MGSRSSDNLGPAVGAVRRYRRGRAGFTMVELLMVIIIVGALLAYGISVMSRALSGNRLLAASGTVVSSLRLARSQAIAQGAIYHVRFINNGNKRGYVLAAWNKSYPLSTDTVDFQSVTSAENLEGIGFAEFVEAHGVVPQGMKFGAGNAVISFWPDGSAVSTLDPAEIPLSDGERTRIITINEFTGRVKDEADTP